MKTLKFLEALMERFFSGLDQALRTNTPFALGIIWPILYTPWVLMKQQLGFSMLTGQYTLPWEFALLNIPAMAVALFFIAMHGASVRRLHIARAGGPWLVLLCCAGAFCLALVSPLAHSAAPYAPMVAMIIALCLASVPLFEEQAWRRFTRVLVALAD